MIHMRRLYPSVAVVALMVSLGGPGLQAKELTLEPQRVSVITCPTESRDVRTLVYFELPSRLREKKADFDNAFLIFRGTVADADFGMVEVFPVTTDWESAGTASWSSPWHSAGGDFSKDVACGSVTLKNEDGEKEVRVNVTLVVKAWVEGVLPNNGIMILGSQTDLENSGMKFGLNADGIRLKIVY